MDEISAVVANITATLKARKNRLAPQIKELRAVRNVFEELEGRSSNDTRLIGPSLHLFSLLQKVHKEKGAI